MTREKRIELADRVLNLIKIWLEKPTWPVRQDLIIALHVFKEALREAE